MKNISNMKSPKKIKRALRQNGGFASVRPLILIALLGITTLSLTSCSDTPSYTSAKALVSQCKTEAVDKKGLCAEQAIQKIPDFYVRGCVESNIDEKKALAKSMSDNTVSDSDLDDIDKVSKECLYYKESTKASGTSYPIFPNFISSAAGSFVGNYMADSLFRSRTDNSNGYYMGGGAGGSAGYTPSTSNGKGGTSATVQQSYKTNSWDVKSFKAASAAKSNWSIGTTGSKWGSSSVRSSSSSSSWGGSKGSSSSFGGGSSSMG